MSVRRWHLAVLVASAGLLAPVQAFGAVLYVKTGAAGAKDGRSWEGAFPTVQTAVEASQSNDEVWVAAGTYAGPIVISKRIQLYGGFAGTETKREERDAKAHPAILDGGRNGGVVRFAPRSWEAVLDGFTIQNGTGFPDHLSIYDPPAASTLSPIPPLLPEARKPDRIQPDTVGGGIYADRAGPVIRNCVVRDCAADYGGGIALRGGGAKVERCTVRDNSATVGGGVAVVMLEEGFSGEFEGYSTSPIVRACRIAGNRAKTGGGIYAEQYALIASGNDIRANGAEVGGGLALRNGSSINNLIRENKAADGGGIALLDHGGGKVMGSVLTGNAASGRGGGIFTRASMPCEIVNNTITGNTAPSGGAVASVGNGGARLVNNIVSGNSSGYLHVPESIARPLPGASARFPEFLSNCFFNNGGKDVEGLPEPPGPDAILRADPRLIVSNDGIPRLGHASPCRDAGSPVLINKGYHEWDIQGQPRVQGSTPDIGADEYGDAAADPHWASAWTAPDRP